MTDFTAQHSATSGNPFLKLLTSIWDGLVYIGENSARAGALDELNKMSDAQLEAAGLTRSDIVQRVFSSI